MPYQTKIPPHKITLVKYKFNELLNYMNSDKISQTDPKIINILTNKILKYSSPYKKESGEEEINIYFYTNELTDFIYILLHNSIPSTQIQVDYYAEVIKQKEEYKKSKNSVEEKQ